MPPFFEAIVKTLILTIGAPAPKFISETSQFSFPIPSNVYHSHDCRAKVPMTMAWCIEGKPGIVIGWAGTLRTIHNARRCRRKLHLGNYRPVKIISFQIIDGLTWLINNQLTVSWWFSGLLHEFINTKYEGNLVIIPHVWLNDSARYFDLINRSSSGARFNEWICKLLIYISTEKFSKYE